ncbi:MAG TPA: DUF1684 domain-containing protein [Pyrinomonadaceae bacterium]|nr:DUF1684 domain-containing protein [Pyrinomonadaceae bacterium]
MWKRRRAPSLSVLLCALLSLSLSCARPAEKVERAAPRGDAGSYAQQVEQWKAQRLASLKGEEGWLALVGLFWLKEGENRFGSDPAGEIVLPAGKAPKLAGVLRMSGDTVRLEAQPGVEITHEGKAVSTLDLRSDADGKPTVLNLGSLSFNLIERGGRLGLRVRDKENPARVNFKGLEYYPTNERWRVEARFEPFNPPKSIPIVNVLGMQEDTPSPGTLHFEVGGKSYSLDALSEAGASELFIIFADETSGRETYGAGRYLYADPPDAQGKVLLDFNKAYSPPCAFTEYATCPLPPQQNKLPLRIEAGEKFSGH